MEDLWYNLHKPSSIDEVYIEKHIEDFAKNVIAKNEFPNVILTGRSGVGKTLIVNLIASNIYSEHLTEYVLELNSSHDRGIKVEDVIQTFCKRKVSDTSLRKKKLVIFEEAEMIMEKTQHIISKLMTEHINTTSFVFICNKSHNIIQSIQSKCKSIHFMPIKKASLVKHLKNICESHNISWSQDGLNELAIASEGDMRKAINLLQAVASKHYDLPSTSCCISKLNVSESHGEPHREILTQIMIHCVDHNLKEALEIIATLVMNGYTNIDIINGLFNITKDPQLFDCPENKRILLCEIIAQGSYNVSKVNTNTKIQLNAVICELCQL